MLEPSLEWHRTLAAIALQTAGHEAGDHGAGEAVMPCKLPFQACKLQSV